MKLAKGLSAEKGSEGQLHLYFLQLSLRNTPWAIKAKEGIKKR